MGHVKMTVNLMMRLPSMMSGTSLTVSGILLAVSARALTMATMSAIFQIGHHMMVTMATALISDERSIPIRLSDSYGNLSHFVTSR